MKNKTKNDIFPPRVINGVNYSPLEQLYDAQREGLDNWLGRVNGQTSQVTDDVEVTEPEPVRGAMEWRTTLR